MTRKTITYTGYAVLLAGLALLAGGVALADGSIDPTDKYAWSTNAGWINFNPANGGVTVYSDHLEGYAWGENIGWIRLGSYDGGGAHTYTNDAADTYGVNNDGLGNLSGYAWSKNVGWFNFSPSNGGVTIDPVTGDFDGYAWGENVGWVHLQNSSPAYKVNTNWRGGGLDPTYGNDMAAIIGTRQPGPASSAGLIIANVSFLHDDDDGIILGHQNGSGVTADDCPAGVSERWQRIWQFDVHDGAGTPGGSVTLTFDFSDAGIGGTPSGDYTLLKRSGLSGEFVGIATSSGPHTGDQVEFSNVDVGDLGSYFTLGSGTPTAVTLAAFTATPQAGAIRLDWEMASELDNLGFNVLRSESLEGERVQLNAAFIPSQNPGSPVGAAYSWLDETAVPGVTYHYWLEAMDVHGGSRLHGPVQAALSAGPYRYYLPLVRGGS
jgi:hypothetical protein